ncbi:MAG: hypothetical protein ACR2PA_27280 [Hyphomicrobiaceae bacterium]
MSIVDFLNRALAGFESEDIWQPENRFRPLMRRAIVISVVFDIQLLIVTASLYRDPS